jgi:uroporphyrin-3 C-methyltransferase
MANEINQSPEKSCTKNRVAWVNIGILFSTFAVIVLLVVFYVGYVQLMRTNAMFAEKINTLQTSLFELQQNDRLSDEKFSALSADVKAISVNDKAVIALAHAGNLIQLANDAIQFEHNSTLAMALLTAADKALQATSSETLVPLRQAIAEDIASLKATTGVDVVGVYARLSALNNQIDQLPLVTHAVSAASTKTVDDVSSLPWWKRGLASTWKMLQHIIVVRHNVEGTLPFMTPEERDFLYQNCHAMLEKAMWALLHRQPEIYRASLEQTATWIKRYFVSDAPMVQNALTTLSQLQQVDVNPSMPQITASMQALNRLQG